MVFQCTLTACQPYLKLRLYKLGELLFSVIKIIITCYFYTIYMFSKISARKIIYLLLTEVRKRNLIMLIMTN